MSRRAGLVWDSLRGGLISVSLEVTSNDLLTTWNTWLFQFNDVSICPTNQFKGKKGKGEQGREKGRTHGDGKGGSLHPSCIL